MDEDIAIGDWVRKSLQEGDDPEVVRTALKNQGHDPSIVDIILNSEMRRTPAKSKPAPKQTEFRNDALKNEVGKIMAHGPVKNKIENNAPESPEPVEPKPAKAMFTWNIRLPELPKLNLAIPKIGLRGMDLDTAHYILIAFIILVVLVLVFFGINWYADHVAKSLLS